MSTSSATDQMYALQEIPGKGKGLVATQKIPKGTRILSEVPIVRVSGEGLDNERYLESIRKQVDALAPDQRAAFLSLRNIYAEDVMPQYLGIVQTNGLPVGTANETGILIDACRINHACDNNGQKNWNNHIQRHVVHALRDIQEGEEITVTYLGVLNNRETRQEALRRRFAFTCSCGLCSLPPDQSRESDRILDKIIMLDRLVSKMGAMGILSAPLRMLRYVDQQIQLYNEHGPDDVGLPRAFLDAAQIVIANGDLARGRIFAERAVRGWITLDGEDGDNVLQHKDLAQDPSKLTLYGMSMTWKTGVNDVPSGLDPNSKEFDDWLWRRQTPQRRGQPADFRNRTSFPSFNELPREHRADPEYYTSSDLSYSRGEELIYQRPRRHWLFLAEIVDFFTLARLQMTVRDVEGNEIPLIFYTELNGAEVPRSQVRKGYTVAILYPEYHAFLFDKPGIRLERWGNFTVFPVSLDKLLSLSDRVQNYSTDTNGTRRCHGCDKQATSLKKCGRCSLFWYCNGTCQSTGWKEKGHNADCKLLKDRDLSALFTAVDWNKFHDHLGFPMSRIALMMQHQDLFQDALRRSLRSGGGYENVHIAAEVQID